MNSKIKHQYDALLAIRDLAARSVAVTADGPAGGYVQLHRLTSGRGDLRGLFGQAPFDVVIFVNSTDNTTGDETYTLKLQTVNAAKASPTDVPGATVPVTAGMVGSPIVLKVDPATIDLADADAAFLTIAADVGGTTPSIKFYAFAAPNSHA